MKKLATMALMFLLHNHDVVSSNPEPDEFTKDVTISTLCAPSFIPDSLSNLDDSLSTIWSFIQDSDLEEAMPAVEIYLAMMWQP